MLIGKVYLRNILIKKKKKKVVHRSKETEILFLSMYIEAEIAMRNIHEILI